jgi:glycosyltransferase involved in cell wall biosynthesis
VKLVIQIPCLNEEETLPETVRSLPREVEGFDRVEVLVVDDGSTDRTVEVARELGVDHVARLPGNKGLAKAFSTGIEVALHLGADVVVNTDGDNQYCADDIGALVAPILAGTADIVIGDRQTRRIPHFSPLKKLLQGLGSWVVRRISGTSVPDATSGFRAFTREAALHLNILSPYSYTLESIIQGARKGLRIVSVPVRTNPVTRASRLMRSMSEFVVRSGMTILRISVFYKPFRFFLGAGLVVFLAGLAVGARFLVYYFAGGGGGHIQSLVLAGALLSMGFTTFVLAVLADLISVNRQLSEDILYRLRRNSLTDGKDGLGDLRGVRLWSRSDRAPEGPA